MKISIRPIVIVSVLMASLEPAVVEGHDIVRPLVLFWNEARTDNFTAGTPEGVASAQDANYVKARYEGQMLLRSEAGAVPLKLYWNSTRSDNFSTATAAGERAAREAGYSFVRIQGYVYSSERPGTVPLKLFWSSSRKDNFTTATPEGERSALAAGYSFVRIEGYVFPPPPETTWEIAGRSEFSIRPLSATRECVSGVRDAFEEIDFGRRRGKNFYSNRAGRADKGHMQGVARLPGGWLVQSFTKGVFLTHFPGKDGLGRSTWSTPPDRGDAVFPDLPDAERGHVGGLHAHGDYIIVPSDGGGEHRVEIFHHDEGRLNRMSTFDLSRYQGNAHYASMLSLKGSGWLLAVGDDSRKRRRQHHVHFYVIPRLNAAPGELRYLGRWGRGKTHDDFQSASLLADCNGEIFFVGTGVRRVQSNAHAKLYQVVSFSRSSGSPPEVTINKLAERSPGSKRNDCNLNAGATFFPTAERQLAMYCTEKEVKNESVTTREYHDEAN